jgi:hypothetical protein
LLGRRTTVTTPAGEQWRVRRLWAPRLQGGQLWRRARRRLSLGRRLAEESGVDGVGSALELLDEIFLVLAVLAVIALAVFLVVPAVLALVDVLVAIVLAALGIVARILFRRPWVVEARSSAGERHRWRVVGWRASREHVASVANALAHGNPLPPGVEATRPTPGAGDGGGPAAIGG